MIPLHVDTPAPIKLTVKEEFVDYDVPEYTGSYNVTPSGSAQALPTNGKLMTDDVTIDAVSIDLQSKTVNPSTTAATVSPDVGYDGLSSVTVNAMPAGLLALPETAYSDRLGVAYIDVTVGVDDDGYVDSSDGFTYPVKVNDIPSLPKQAAATITPTTSSQTAVTAKKWTTGAVTVDPIPSQYIVPTGTKAITANTSSVDVKTYEFASVNVPNSYAAGDEGKVVSNGALVAQTSDTCTTNGVVDTTLINSLDVNVSGSSGKVLLASETAASDVQAMTISYDAATMAAYDYFEIEIEGKSIAGKAFYPCPQLNGTSAKQYNGYVGGNTNFHFRFPVAPYFYTNGTVQGHRVSIGASNTQVAVNGAITSFDVVSYYSDGGMKANSTMKVWGIPT